MATHRFVFAISFGTLAIFVAFVAGDDHNRGDFSAGGPDGFQQVDCSHDVGGIRAHRVLITIAHEGLSGHVNDDLSVRLSNCG